MKTRNGIPITAGILAVAALVPWVGHAEAILHGRVSFDTGGVLIKGVEESDWTDASVNTLVLPNDTLWVDNGGTAEVEFSGGNFVRLADGSKAEVVSLPPNGAIRGWIGSFYLQRLNRSQGDFVFYTPAGAIEIDKDSMVRVDIVSEGITTVSTRWGRATVRTDAGGTVQAYAGKRVFIETGLLPSEPTPYDRTDEDAFDRWNRERAEYLATGSTQTPVEIDNSTLGVTDLDRYGEWVYVDNRPYWRPTVVVDYTPYRYGYWNHVGSIGNVWVGNYPFSYVTSHYGYWDYTPRYGWCWSYDRVWSPAWCATVRYGDYFVWSPINRYHRPVYPTTSAYFSIGGVSFGYLGTSCVRVSDVYAGPSYVHFANYDPFRRYYGSGNVNINIWNINTGSRRPQVRVPYSNDSVFTVRDYTPRRSIRGSSTLFASNRSASERVQRLESTTGRSTFSRSSRTGSEFVRTNSARIDQSNRTRNVRLTESAPDYSRASRSNPVVASSTRSRSGSGLVERSGNDRDRQASTRAGTTVSRTGESSNRAERGSRTATRQTATTPDTDSSRTRSRTTISNRTDDTPRRTTAPSSFDNDPLRVHNRPARTSVPQRTESASTAPERTRTSPQVDSGRTATRSTATSTRTQIRTESPRVNVAPERVTTRERGRSTTSASPSDRGSVSRTTPTAPERTSTPSRSSSFSRGNDSSPRVIERTTPPSRSSSSSRSYTAPSRDSSSSRSSASPPSRSSSTSRSYTAPSRSSSSSSSSRSYTAPSRSSSSSRSYTAPSRDSSSSRSVSPPSRNSSSSRSYTAPSRESSSSRSYTAPSRSSSSSRGYTAPSRDTNSSRSYTAPSRDTSSSRSYSAPSSSSSSRGSISSRSSGSRSISGGRASSSNRARGR